MAGVTRAAGHTRTGDGSDSHEGLDPGFTAAWKAEAKVEAFREAQDAERDRVYFDVGYSFRVLHDAFGLHQQLLSIDFAVPLNRHDPYSMCLGIPRASLERPPFVVLVSFFPSF